MPKQKQKVEQDNDSEMLRYRDAARFIGLALPTLYSKVSRKEIPHYRLGRRLVVFSRDELQAWMEERRVSPTMSAITLESETDGGTK